MAFGALCTWKQQQHSQKPPMTSQGLGPKPHQGTRPLDPYFSSPISETRGVACSLRMSSTFPLLGEGRSRTYGGAS